VNFTFQIEVPISKTMYLIIPSMLIVAAHALVDLDTLMCATEFMS